MDQSTASLEALITFFEKEIANLPKTYNWSIPLIAGFKHSGARGYEPNLALKRYLKTEWEQASSQEKRREIAEIIIRDWGGIRRNSAYTIDSYIEAAIGFKPPNRLEGVASYSKLFAIIAPNRFAIYDSRVAACLNAVQINAGVRDGVAFNYVPGRNNIIGKVTTQNGVTVRTGFTLDSRYEIGALAKAGWSEIQKNNTYTKYLAMLDLCQKELPGTSLTSLEMALFANAEQECQRALDKT